MFKQSVQSDSQAVIDALWRFPTLDNQTMPVDLLVDTGADRTILAPIDSRRLAAELSIDLAASLWASPAPASAGR